MLCLILYFAGTLNFYIGSNSQFFNTAFEYNGSQWYNEKHNLTATVFDGRTMEIIDNDTKEAYILVSHGDKIVELFKKADYCNLPPTIYTDDDKLLKADYYNTPTAPSVFTDEVVYKKRFGKIYKFIIKGKNQHLWTASGNEQLVFYKK